MQRVSLSDISRNTGFSISAVSKALRNSPDIPAKTRNKIELAARELGYHPNPLLASLASKHFNSKQNLGTPVAYLQLPEFTPPQSMVSLKERGRLLGYEVEPFNVAEFTNGTHAARVLYARGFQGIIVSPEIRFDMLPGMEWNHFCVVGWGGGIAAQFPFLAPWLYRVTVDHFRSVLQAWEETRARGYTRIGFVLFRGEGKLLDDQSRFGAAQLCLQSAPFRGRIPICVPENDPQYGLNSQELAKWVRRHSPDAVIGFNGAVRWALSYENFRVPDDIGFVSLHKGNSDLLHITNETESGMKSMELECMLGALELLDQQIRHHSYGLPPKPRTLNIYSEWMDGDSLPRRTKNKS